MTSVSLGADQVTVPLIFLICMRGLAWKVFGET